MNYTIEHLLNRAYDKLNELNKKENKKQKIFVKPDIVNHNRKSYITNFTKFCASINRDLESVRQFINKDMNTNTSLLGDNLNYDETSGLKFNAIYKSSLIMNTITNYMKEYVLCGLCKSGNTQILKIERINYISCDSCKSQKAI